MKNAKICPREIGRRGSPTFSNLVPNQDYGTFRAREEAKKKCRMRQEVGGKRI